MEQRKSASAAPAGSNPASGTLTMMPTNSPKRKRKSTGTRKRRRGGILAFLFVMILLLALITAWVVLSLRTLSSTMADPNNHNNILGGGIASASDINAKAAGAIANIGSMQPMQSPLLIFTCARANYLQTTLETILKYIPTTCRMGCPIVVSQDLQKDNVAHVIEEFQAKFAAKGIPLFHLLHPSSPNLRGNAYQLLAVHYGWALRTLFDGHAYSQVPTTNNNPSIYQNLPLPERVIILEEDLRIAPDFFGYFEATAPLLDSDPSLLAVSAFNDNGYEGTVKDPQRLLRSDFFPGLGWMMTRNTWVNDLGAKWPNGYWDDWLREPVQRQGRFVIRPEITRTFHFGENGGASANQFGGNLNRVHLNTEPVDWKTQDLSYLHPEAFERGYARLVANAQPAATLEEALGIVEKGKDARVEYNGKAGFIKKAKELKLMDDEKAGIYRTAYKGVVETRPNGNNFLFLTEPLDELKRKFGANWPSG